MSYRDTARAYARASTTGDRWTSTAITLDTVTRGVPQHHADGYEPGKKARAYVAHVESLAADLREALAWYDDDSESGGGIVLGGMAVATASRALLAAIGEDA